jgi:RimJ/RimL family protein N-acetyltransferase
MKPTETFETPHLRLRRPLPSDAEAVFEYGGDPQVARFADWPVRTSIDGLAESLLARAARWESDEEFYWVIAPCPVNFAAVRPRGRSLAGTTDLPTSWPGPRRAAAFHRATGGRS